MNRLNEMVEQIRDLKDSKETEYASLKEQLQSAGSTLEEMKTTCVRCSSLYAMR
jgi:hypothetical protein